MNYTLSEVEADIVLLFDVYEAVSESDQVHMFDLHQNPNNQCIVGE